MRHAEMIEGNTHARPGSHALCAGPDSIGGAQLKRRASCPAPSTGRTMTPDWPCRVALGHCAARFVEAPLCGSRESPDERAVERCATRTASKVKPASGCRFGCFFFLETPLSPRAIEVLFSGVLSAVVKSTGFELFVDVGLEWLVLKNDRENERVIRRRTRDESIDKTGVWYRFKKTLNLVR